MSVRPLSPYLQIYRLPLTAVLSITHRISGVVLTLGLLLMAALLMAAAEGAECYEPVRIFLGSTLGRSLLWAWLYALFFHLCHGLRHLIWDAGHCYDKAVLNRHAGLELAVSVILTGFAVLARNV